MTGFTGYQKPNGSGARIYNEMRNKMITTSLEKYTPIYEDEAYQKTKCIMEQQSIREFQYASGFKLQHTDRRHLGY